MCVSRLPHNGGGVPAYESRARTADPPGLLLHVKTNTNTLGVCVKTQLH